MPQPAEPVTLVSASGILRAPWAQSQKDLVADAALTKTAGLAAPSAGPVGNGWDLNAGSGVRAASHPLGFTPSGSQNRSLVCYFTYRATGASQTLVGYNSAADGTSTEGDRVLFIDSAGRLNFQTYDDVQRLATDPTALTDGQTYLAIATNPSAQHPTDPLTNRLYRGATQVATVGTTSAGYGAYVAGTVHFVMGNSASFGQGASRVYYGLLMDHVMDSTERSDLANDPWRLFQGSVAAAARRLVFVRQDPFALPLPGLAFTTQPTSGTEGTVMTIAVSVPGGTGDVTFQIKAADGADAGAPVTATPSGGSASANVTRPSAGSAYFYTATRTGVASATSATFSTTAASGQEAAAISFTNQDATNNLAAGVCTFGYVFLPGEIPSGSGVEMLDGGSTVRPCQADVKTRHADSSIHFAVLSFRRPALAGGETLTGTLRAGSAATGTNVDLAAALTANPLSVTMAYSQPSAHGSSGSTGVVPPNPGSAYDLSGAVAATLSGTPDRWMHGPYASSARAIVYIENTTQRFVVDATAFLRANSTVDMAYDVRWANDRTMETGTHMGRVKYTTVATLSGAQVANETLEIAQHMSWHRKFYSSGSKSGWQGLDNKLNIKIPFARLIASKAIADYDTTIAVPSSSVTSAASQLSDANWGKPLQPNGQALVWKEVGGRPDIGLMTAAELTWLRTGDWTLARYAMGHAEVACYPNWHYWDRANNKYLTTANWPLLWTEGGFGAGGSPSNPNSARPTQDPEVIYSYDAGTNFLPAMPGWCIDLQHPPELSFVPYIMTGQRWIYDNVVSHASWCIHYILRSWREVGVDGLSWETVYGVGTKDLVFYRQQVRAGAWGMRYLENLRWIGVDGSAEKAYATSVADNNWNWLRDKWIPANQSAQGEAHGYHNPGTHPDYIGTYMQGYHNHVICLALRRRPTAANIAAWHAFHLNWQLGRHEQAAGTFQWQDGGNQFFVFGSNYTPLTTWSALRQRHLDTQLGQNWPNRPVNAPLAYDGNYANITMSSLGAIHRLYSKECAGLTNAASYASRAQTAYNRYVTANPAHPAVSRAAVESEANWTCTLGTFNTNPAI